MYLVIESYLKCKVIYKATSFLIIEKLYLAYLFYIANYGGTDYHEVLYMWMFR